MNTTSKHEVRVDVKANDGASKSFNSIAGSAVKLGAAFLGLRQITSTLHSWYIDFEKMAIASSKLKIALKNIGRQSDFETLIGFSSSLKDVTTITDETTLELMRFGVSLGLTGDTLKAATIAAIGFQASLDWDLHTAMQNVEKASRGNFKSFQQLGIITKEVTDNTEAFAQVLNKGLDGFKMQRDEIDATVKSVKDLNNSWSDLGKSVWSGSVGDLFRGVANFTKDVLKGTNFLLNASGENIELALAKKKLQDLESQIAKREKDRNKPENWFNSAFDKETNILRGQAKFQRYFITEIEKNIGEAYAKDYFKKEIDAESIIKKAKANIPNAAAKEESAFGDMAGDGVRRGGGSGESRFLTMRAGSPIDRTAENTRKMAEMQGLSLRTLNLIYDVLSRGGSVRDIEYGRGYKSYGAATSFS